ncbi:MAG: hypothetical protein C4558_07250 [Dehalococcoidia bacterium]|nr:MAG: hypothetical protein C4558_07250 [Dehalococcoidia bacterium]
MRAEPVAQGFEDSSRPNGDMNRRARGLPQGAFRFLGRGRSIHRDYQTWIGTRQSRLTTAEPLLAPRDAIPQL